MKHIFHVHTFRCKHGSDESDEDYIRTALSLGAEKITFTDHCTYPRNPFKNHCHPAMCSGSSRCRRLSR